MRNLIPYFRKRAIKTLLEDNFKPDALESKKRTILLLDSDGLSHYTSYLAFGLSQYRHIILYGFSSNYYVVSGAANRKKIKFHNVKERLPHGNSLIKIVFQSLYLFFILLGAITKSKYDIVHFQGYLPMFFLLIPILKLKGKRIFWTMHDTTIMPSYKGAKGQLEISYIKITSQPSTLIRYTDKIIVHANSLKEYLKSKGIKEDKIHVIPHFDYRYLLSYYDNNHVTNTASSNIAKFTRSKSLSNYILFFGHITPYKGVDVLINAARIAKKQIQNTNRFNILIAGNGDISYFNGLIKEDDHKYIHIYNNYITSSEIPHLVNNSIFLVLPYTSTFRSQSGVIPLSYTFSKPVIASNVESLTEYVEHGKTGFIFETGNSEQLANYMIELLENNSKCVEMGKNAYEKMLHQMSLERCCEILNKLYDSGT
jgi:alpha-maltose-1-phosphate synthase